jgi:Uma2 family endonuclease
MNIRSAIARNDLPHRLFTVKDVERMVEVGLIQENERVELIEGELVPMSPKGNRHEVVKQALLELWYPLRDPVAALIPETTFRISEYTYLEPDICIYPREVGLAGLNPATVLLVVEIGVTSLGYDLGVKSVVYAHYGVRELWVIDATDGAIHVHRDPIDGKYGSVVRIPAADLAVPAFAPEAFAVRLADLDLDL